MNHTISIAVCVLSFSALLCASRAQADERGLDPSLGNDSSFLYRTTADPASKEKTSGEVSLTAAGISGSGQSAKFEEYQNVPNVSGDMRIEDRPDKDHYYEFIGYHIGLNDQFE